MEEIMIIRNEDMMKESDANNIIENEVEETAVEKERAGKIDEDIVETVSKTPMSHLSEKNEESLSPGILPNDIIEQELSVNKEDGLEEFVNKHPTLPDPVAKYLEKHRISAYCISQNGESHIKKGKVCQDRSGIRINENRGIIISAIADGVGSCAYSDWGAECAVETSLDVCERAIKNNIELSPSTMGNLLREAMGRACDAVENCANYLEVFPYFLQSTLTLAIYDGKNLYMGHAGDDGIVVITENGGCHLATVRHKGEEASSVFPLQSRTTWQFGMSTSVAAYFMCTDGVLDGFVHDDTENNRVYYPFVEMDVSETLNDLNMVKKMCEKRSEILKSKEYRERVTDDLTFVAVVNQKVMADVKAKIRFDKNKWNADTKDIQRKRLEIVREFEEQQMEAIKNKTAKRQSIQDDSLPSNQSSTSNKVVGKEFIDYSVYVKGYTKEANNNPGLVGLGKTTEQPNYPEGFKKNPSDTIQCSYENANPNYCGGVYKTQQAYGYQRESSIRQVQLDYQEFSDQQDKVLQRNGMGERGQVEKREEEKRQTNSIRQKELTRQGKLYQQVFDSQYIDSMTQHTQSIVNEFGKIQEEAGQMVQDSYAVVKGTILRIKKEN